MTAASESVAPAGLPGKLRTRDVPRTPQSPRLSAARAVFLDPSNLIFSATPGNCREHTACVASGVTSRGPIPVPPVVTTRRLRPVAAISASSICFCSSGKTRASTMEKLDSRSAFATAGPETSSRSPRAEESEIVKTAAVNSISPMECHFARKRRRQAWSDPESSCRAAHLLLRAFPHRARIRPASAVLPSTVLAYSDWCSARWTYLRNRSENFLPSSAAP